MKKNQSNLNFVFTGRIVSNKDHSGIAGVVIKAVDSDSKKEMERAISNEDGGFHFFFKPVDPTATHEVLLKLFDVNSKQLGGAEKAIPLKAGSEQTDVELTVDDEEIQSHRASVRSLKPREGRVFSEDKLKEIYGAINQFGNTSKKYSFGGGMEPGLTCPFPEMNDFEELLFDAWVTVLGDPAAFFRFKNTLDTIGFSMSQRRGIRTEIDFKSRQWRNYIDAGRKYYGHARTNLSATSSSPLGWLGGLLERLWEWLGGEKPEARGHSRRINDPMVPLENAALLMLAANYIAGKDDKLSNHYRNIVLSQIMEFAAVAPIYRTAHNSLLGDVKSQGDLRTMIHYWGEDCGGGFTPFEDPTGRLIWDPSKLMEPELEELLGCLDEMMTPPPTLRYEYRIDGMTPNNGCGGDTAILSGSGFVPGGEVRFVGPTVGTTVSATPTRWSDTELEFVIPFGATYGPVSLYYPFRNGVVVCGTVSSELYIDESALPTIFTGGRPRLDSISFLKNNVQFDPLSETVLPGEVVTLVYESSTNAPNRSIEARRAQIRLSDGWFGESDTLDENHVLFQGFGGPSRTSRTLPSTDFDRSTKITCYISLTNRCGTTNGSAYFIVHRPAVVALKGIEVTQATQFFKASEHIQNSTEHKPDNSVPLLANRPTLVRVFYSTTQFGFNGGKSFGLSVRLRGFMGDEELNNSPWPAINSENLFAVWNSNFSRLRGSLTLSADFLLPHSWIIQTRRVEESGGEFNSILDTPLSLVAELGIQPSEPWIRDTIDTDNDEIALTNLRFNNTAIMSCVVVRVIYTGPGSNATLAPTFNACEATLDLASRLYPADGLELVLPPNRDDRIKTFSNDITVNPGNQGGCGPGWDDILSDLAFMAFFTTGDDAAVWTAFLNPGISFGIVLGCGGQRGGARVLAIPAGTVNVNALLHELGHSYGISEHADDFESGYPFYFGNQDVPLNTGIGEFGVNVGSIPANLDNLDSAVFPPTVPDIMTSFAGVPRWFSPFTYQQLLDRFFSSTEPGEVESSSAIVLRRSFGEMIFISGTIDTSTGSASMSPIFHLPAKSSLRKGKPSGYEIVLLDANKQIIHRTQILMGRNEKNRLYIFERVPLPHAVKHLEIRDRKEGTIWKTEVGDRPPALQGLQLEKKEGRYTLTWQCSTNSGEYWCGVQLTCDDGRTWVTLNGLEQRIQAYSFDPAKFGGGERCRLRVFVTDGFNTSRSETEPFSLPVVPPEIHPVNFDAETEFFAGIAYELRVQPVYILGVPHRTELTWYLNKKEIGKGKKVSVSFDPGNHLMEVIPIDFEEAAITFSITVKEKSNKAVKMP